MAAMVVAGVLPAEAEATVMPEADRGVGQRGDERATPTSRRPSGLNVRWPMTSRCSVVGMRTTPKLSNFLIRTGLSCSAVAMVLPS